MNANPLIVRFLTLAPTLIAFLIIASETRVFKLGSTLACGPRIVILSFVTVADSKYSPAARRMIAPGSAASRAS